MIYFLLIIAAVVLAILEFFWARYSLDALHCESETDHILAEPNEEIIWSATVENRSRMPVPFARLTASFPNEVTLLSEPSHIRRKSDVNIAGYPVEEKMSLSPHKSATRKIHLSIPRRGQYWFGSYELSSGDLLGFRETSKGGAAQKIVIMPERTKQQTSLDALGGFLGDISVRRFILEDPILTMGFRDYTGCEPMKSISWTRSATAGSLQVKQFDHTAEQHVVVLLNSEGANPEVFEECLRLTRTVCEQLERKKIPYGFRTNGNISGPVCKIFHMAEGLGERHLNTILYGLGRGDRTCFYSFRYLVEQTIRHRSSNESYIIITPPLEGRAAAAARKLENAVGNKLCILAARPEVKQ